MAEWNDFNPAPGGRVSAPVKLYDAARGYGFLAPGGGLPDIFCHASVLREVGLDMLIEGATVTCETVRGDRGPQVARILAVDFSTAGPARGAGRPPWEPAPAAPGPAPGQPVRALVKWYVPAKGYGFLTPEDGTGDLFCHAAVVEASGREALPQGAAVTCEVARGEKGPQVSRIVSVEPVPKREFHAVNGPPSVSHETAWHDREPAGPSVEVLGTVKFYDPVRGFGFVVPDEGGREVFVHMSALARSGLDDLQPGQRVSAWVKEVPRGLQATELAPI
ncbi:MAG: cold shock domain-containing protein [Defluviicoccus sp.]|nr:cold shock domain-containing protein [Defluviicoccus sp.]MDE0278739.1 cold shock domain-containing protein [Defluviicoccus sp.]